MFDITPKPVLYKNFYNYVVGWDEALCHIDALEKDGGINDKSIVLRHSHGFISYKAERLESVQPLLKF